MPKAGKKTGWKDFFDLLFYFTTHFEQVFEQRNLVWIRYAINDDWKDKHRKHFGDKHRN